MNEIKRLQELAGINEIKVNKPVSKKELIDIIYDFNEYFLYPLIKSQNLENLIEGYDSIEEYLEYDYGYDEPNLSKAKSLIENFYKIISPGDIIVVDDRSSVLGFKNMELITPSDSDTYAILTKF